MSWYRKAADQGDAGAKLLMGVAYSTGRGVPQDPVYADVWYTRASREHGLATWNCVIGFALGVLCTENLRCLAEQGHALSCSQLYGAAAERQCVAQDIEAAVSWYRKAPEGNALVMRCTARDNGIGTAGTVVS